MIKVQAREIVRFAKKHNLELTHMGIGTLLRRDRGRSTNKVCATGVAASMLGCDSMYDLEEGNYDRSKTNLTPEDFLALEWGFERWVCSNKKIVDNRYYKVGRNVARLAGLR